MIYLRNIIFFVLFFFSAFTYAGSCQEIWKVIHQNYDLGEYRSVDGLCGGEFRSALAQLISTNIDLSYRGARYQMFSRLDNRDGEVCGVYTGVCIKTRGIPNSNKMNCEHSWPQSRGAVGIAKDDLHHLFPVDSKVNSRRSNYPFCNVDRAKWSGGGSRFGVDASGDTCFEPRDEHKGDVARAMFYFALRYHKAIDPAQEEALRGWLELDPVSEKELERNDEIDELQHNRNPFIDIPEFVDLISDF